MQISAKLATMIVVLTVLAVPAIPILARAQAPAPFGGPGDVAFARELWAALDRARLVGPARINSAAFRGHEPHGSIQQVLTTTLELRGRRARVIVKANHGGREGLTPDGVYAEPNANLMAYTVMFAREAGYDPEDRDWFWAKYRPFGALDTAPDGTPLAGRVAKGKPEGCIACHRKKGGADLEVLTRN